MQGKHKDHGLKSIRTMAEAAQELPTDLPRELSLVLAAREAR